MKVLIYLSLFGFCSGVTAQNSAAWDEKYARWMKTPAKYGGVEVLEKIKGAKQSKATSLHLSDKNISDITPLSELTELRGLFLFDNNITDISPLSGLKKLDGLNLCDNKIRNITPLIGLKNLKILGLAGNPIPNDQLQTIKKKLGRTRLILPKVP